MYSLQGWKEKVKPFELRMRIGWYKFRFVLLTIAIKLFGGNFVKIGPGRPVFYMQTIIFVEDVMHGISSILDSLCAKHVTLP